MQCACGGKDLFLLGFEVAPDLRTVLVNYRCPACGQVTRGKYAEAPEKLREG